MNNNNTKKTYLSVAISFLLLIVIVRLTAPTIITSYVNRVIEKTDAIVGTVESIDLALIAGSYRINKINIRQAGDTAERPLFVANNMDVSMSWSQLLKGKLVTEIVLIEPIVGLYDTPDGRIIKNEAIKDKKTWVGLARNLTPFSINKLTVKNGVFKMDAQAELKRSEFSIENIQLIVNNIANSKDSGIVAKAEMTGDIQNKAKITLKASFDPNTTKPTFDIDLEMGKLPVSYVDSLIKFYAPFDLEAGQIDMASEIKSSEGQVEGYVEVGVYNLEVFSWHQDVVEDNDNPISLTIDFAGEIIANIFENKDNNKDLIATRIPINGSIDSPDVSSIDAFFGLIYNAFVTAYSLKVDNSISD